MTRRKPTRGRAPTPLAKPKQRAALPTKDEVLEFIRTSPIKVGKREIARAFGIKGADKIGLKGLLKDIEREGQVVRERNESGRGRTRRFAPPDAIPKTTMIEIIGLDIDEGEALARPLDWTGPDAPAELRVHAERRAGAALSIGMRALARIERAPDGRYTAHILRAIEGAPDRVLGVYAPDAEGGRLQPTDRKIKTEFAVALSDNGGAKPGQLVLAEALPSRRLGLPRARVIEVLGSMASPKAASLIAIHAQGIPTVFDDAALAESTRARPAPMGQREDLRQVPLVTIDGEDARDFDDAVFAEPDDDPKNPGGFHLIVAIADVAWYVRPASALDRTARARGNSVYFPDRVVPMLPEKLSNDLCSLRPDEDRPTLAVHIWIDAAGRKRRHRFTRAMIRSAARLTYDQAQNGIDDQPNGAPKELLKPVIEPLYAAFRALSKARRQRGTLDLDLEERKVVLGPDGRIEKIVPRPRYDSHRLIEEFMILANVCAAESLEDRRLPCMYRVHEDPSPEKLESLREVLDGLGYRLAKGQVLKPAQFNRILEWATDTPFRHLVNDMVLRSQSLAVYSPDNKGHFGLALVRYAHFTSPIRRYADLLVHRALIAGYGFGEGGLFDKGTVDFHDVADHISATERRAAMAERDALNRYVVAFLSDKVGARFAGRVSGVTRFGLFVTLDGLGADGLAPIRSLPADYYHHDEVRHRLVGQRSGRVFTLGEPVEVRLVEAAPVTGGLVFEILDGGRIEPQRDRDRAAKGHGERMKRGRKRR